MIRWFAQNGVAANLLMLVIFAGGLFSLFKTKIELFPPFSLDTISIRVPYPGAAPEEVEKSICIRIEERIQDLSGIKELSSSSVEGIGTVSVKVETGYDASELLDEIKMRVDSIDTFPADAEQPVIEEVLIKRMVLNVAVFGDADERSLKWVAERVRDDLVAIPGISQVEVTGIRDYEISVNVSENDLRRYQLTFDQVVAAIKQSSIDLPGGSIRSESGDILLRTVGQAYVREDFESIVVLQRTDGTVLTLGDFATIDDGFTDAELETAFNGKPAANLIVYEVGNQSPLDISAKVNAYLEKARAQWLPEGIDLMVWQDFSFYLEARLNMLIKNGFIGLILVFAILTVFLRPSLAFWVTFGIPVSFLGTFFIMPFADLSINLISLFGFILVLGIVVDDAIVVGESVFSVYQEKGTGIQSTIEGVERVAIPVTFAVLTTIVAFIPMLLLPGTNGKFLVAIPLVVIPTLLFSLVESKLILPYHLSLCHVGEHRRNQLNLFQRFQRKVADGLEHYVKVIYEPILAWVLPRKYLMTAVFIGVLIVTGGTLRGGWIKTMPGVPEVPSDYIIVSLSFPDGAPASQTRRALNRINAGLDAAVAELQTLGYKDVFQKRKTTLGASTSGGGPGGIELSENRPNLGEIVIELAKSEQRELSAVELADRWRAAIGPIPGVEKLIFRATAAGGYGEPVDIQLRSGDLTQLREAAVELKATLATYKGLFDIRDNLAYGQKEIQLKVKPAAEVLGIRQADLGRQVRQAFYGEEAQRVQRGRDDIRVMVRYPEAERKSVENLQSMRIRTAQGAEVAFSEVAEIDISNGYSAIQRMDRARVVNVIANVNKETTDLAGIIGALQKKVVPDLEQKYPEVRASFEGQVREDREASLSLFFNGILVLFVMYALMAVPFKSYLQPLIVMSVIPFGLIGAVLGHFLLGHPISQLSIFGIVALSGVVVNDSLVMVDCINQLRLKGMSLKDAVITAGSNRFRPIMLTSLTTFVGLVPILMETSLQAQFLIPMAISLSFGVLFATLITLLMVPCVYLILEDLKCGLKALGRWLWTGDFRSEQKDFV